MKKEMGGRVWIDFEVAKNVRILRGSNKTLFKKGTGYLSAIFFLFYKRINSFKIKVNESSGSIDSRMFRENEI